MITFPSMIMAYYSEIAKLRSKRLAHVNVVPTTENVESLIGKLTG
jgi:hypothetical protein